MELKYSKITTQMPFVQFKLYLYGIEILVFDNGMNPQQRFKLYLYGIEIGAPPKASGRESPVQIVPLWN